MPTPEVGAPRGREYRGAATSEMKAFDTISNALHPAASAPEPARPDAAEVTNWLLDGRFFTVDTSGTVTSWSLMAAETFGWRRQDVVGQPFLDTLLAAPARAAQTERVEALLAGAGAGAGDGVTFTGEVDALDSRDKPLRVAFALVPIELGVGYEFNALLQGIASRPRDSGSPAEQRSRHETVLAMVEQALGGGGGRGGDGDGDEDGARVAGAVVVFELGAGAAAAGGGAAAGSEPDDGPPVDNVVSISDAPGSEEARVQLERARRDAEDGRVEIRSLEGQLEEARREAQRSRNEADVARQEAGDARDALIVAQRGAEEARRQLEDARRTMDEVRAAAEAGRIRSEEAQREADSLRAQLREARDSVRGMAGRADDDLAEAQEHAAHADRELLEARAEVARHEAEVEPLRERYQAAQRELGSLRADLESAQAAAAERETVGARRAEELERVRAELEVGASELAAVREQLEAARAQAEGNNAAAVAHAELDAVRERLERMRAAFERGPVGGVLIAPDGRYLEVSDTLCEALGYEREQLLAADPPALVHVDDIDAQRDVMRRMLAGERAAARARRRYLRADGREIEMNESVSLVRDGDGRPSMFVVQLEEVDRHNPEVEAAEDAAELGLAADERSAGLTGEAMQRALEDDLFQLHCQPVLDLQTNTVTQYELLLRMTAEDGRLILPQAFLPTARRAGLAHAIDRWVVRKAIRLLHETALVGHDLSLEVNLSPEAVHDPDLPVLIDQELAGTPIDPSRLVLEVTGATASEHLEETRALAKRLRALGCRFALDDFRSNFGSFNLLRDIPLDYLKLDGELVGSLAESRTSQLIVKALVDVAAGAGMKTVAVFVSDDETLDMLRQQGVDYAQGYTVGRPRPVEDVLGSAG